MIFPNLPLNQTGAPTATRSSIYQGPHPSQSRMQFLQDLGGTLTVYSHGCVTGWELWLTVLIQDLECFILHTRNRLKLKM